MEFSISLQKACFDQVAFKREILYFQYRFQKAATISFYCIQYYEYDQCFFYSFATSWDFTYILVLLILDVTYLVVLVVVILKSNLEKIRKPIHAF